MVKPKEDFIQRSKERQDTELLPSVNVERVLNNLEDETNSYIARNGVVSKFLYLSRDATDGNLGYELQ
jgi:hypothetical protein